MPFFAKLSSAPGRRRGVKGRAAGNLLTAMVAVLTFVLQQRLALPQNADHYRHPTRNRIAGDGRRASAGNAAGTVDSHNSDRIAATVPPRPRIGTLVCGIPYS